MSFKIKDPDRHLALENPVFMTKTERAWLFAEQHRGGIIAGMVLLVLVGILLGGVFWYQHNENLQALTLQHAATTMYLDRPLDDVALSAQNLEKAVALFQEVIQKYPSSPSAELAQYFLGNARVEQRDYSTAINTYNTFIQKHQSNPMLTGLVYQRLGAAHLLNQDRAKAIDAFTTVLGMPEAINQDQVLFELAKLEEAEEATDRALTYYKRLVDQFPHSPYAGEAALQVKALNPQPSAAAPEQGTQEPMTEDTKTTTAE